MPDSHRLLHALGRGGQWVSLARSIPARGMRLLQLPKTRPLRGLPCSPGRGTSIQSWWGNEGCLSLGEELGTSSRCPTLRVEASQGIYLYTVMYSQAQAPGVAGLGWMRNVLDQSGTWRLG